MNTEDYTNMCKAPSYEEFESIKVGITLTITKDVWIDVNKKSLPLSNEDLKEEIRNQITMPHQLPELVKNGKVWLPSDKKALLFINDLIKPCKAWDEANLEVEEL